MESNIYQEQKGAMPEAPRSNRAHRAQVLIAGAMLGGIIVMFPLAEGTHMHEDTLFIIQGVLAVLAFAAYPPQFVRRDKRRYGLDILFSICYIVLAGYFLLVGLLYLMFNDLGAGWYGTT